MGVKRLNQPVPANVQLGDDDRPARVEWVPPARSARQVRREQVESVIDLWYVDDAWWTAQPVRRMYYECQLAGGMRLIIVYDLTTDRWSVQR